MKTFLLICLMFTSCNIAKTLTDGETKVPDEFYPDECRDNCGDGNTLENGYVHSYTFDDSGNRGTDYRSNYDLTMSSDSYIARGGGSAIDCAFSASTVGTVAGNGMSGASHFTIAFWLKTPAGSNGNSSIMESNDGVNLKITYEPVDGDDNLQLSVASQGDLVVNNFFNETAGTWIHIAIVGYENSGDSTFDVYKNGSMHHSGLNYTGIHPLTLSGFRICDPQSAFVSGNHFNGALDNISFWSRTLSESEISTVFNQ